MYVYITSLQPKAGRDFPFTCTHQPMLAPDVACQRHQSEQHWIGGEGAFQKS